MGNFWKIIAGLIVLTVSIVVLTQTDLITIIFICTLAIFTGLLSIVNGVMGWMEDK